MIDLDFSLFLDKPGVIAKINAGVRKALSKWGAFVRTSARSSIRTRKGIAEAGKPPSSHTGKLKSFIYFSYDPDSQSVVVGPALLNGVRRYGDPATYLLEKGGASYTYKGKPAVYKAHPYMQPAFDKNTGLAAECFADAVN